MFQIWLLINGILAYAMTFYGAAYISADEFIFDSVSDWKRWSFPNEAVEIDSRGRIRPRPINRDVNAVGEAKLYGGGIRAVGSNLRDANKIIDGDESSGWSPDVQDLSKGGWIEIDLGRAVSATWIELVFDRRAPPFELFDLLISNGMMMRDQTRSFIESTLVYGVNKRYVKNKSHRVRFWLEDPKLSIVKNIRIQILKMFKEASLTEVIVQEFGNNLVLEAPDRGGGIDIAVEVENPLSVSKGRVHAAADGLITTAWYPTGREVNSEDTYAHIRVDLGAVYWVDQVRLISDLGQKFDFHLYELATSDGSLAPNNTLVWKKHFSGKQNETLNKIGLADHFFGPIAAKFVQVRWKFWDSNCQNGRQENTGCFSTGRTQEIQVFGKGLPRRVVLKSPIIDLGSDKNVYSLRWEADVEPGSFLELRSRSGNELQQQKKFFDHNKKEVTEKVWNRLIPSFRGRIDTFFVVGNDWSPWSRIYKVSGESFLSPSPTQYMELEAQLVSNSDAKNPVRLDRISVDFSSPIAGEVVGEVYPNKIPAGVFTDFSYYLRAERCPNGFDEIMVESTAPLQVKEVLVNNVSKTPIISRIKNGLRFFFPTRILQGEIVELKFVSRVHINGTKIESFISETGTNKKFRQRVQPGDAFSGNESNTNVLKIPLSDKLFSDLVLESRIVTPNGDGINDVLMVEFGVLNVNKFRKLIFSVFDLAGNLQFQIDNKTVAGPRGFVWDGMNRNGRLVSSGMYIVHISMHVDSGIYTDKRVVSVSY